MITPASRQLGWQTLVFRVVDTEDQRWVAVTLRDDPSYSLRVSREFFRVLDLSPFSGAVFWIRGDVTSWQERAITFQQHPLTGAGMGEPPAEVIKR